MVPRTRSWTYTIMGVCINIVPHGGSPKVFIFCVNRSELHFGVGSNKSMPSHFGPILMLMFEPQSRLLKFMFRARTNLISSKLWAWKHIQLILVTDKWPVDLQCWNISLYCWSYVVLCQYWTMQLDICIGGFRSHIRGLHEGFMIPSSKHGVFIIPHSKYECKWVRFGSGHVVPGPGLGSLYRI